MRTSLSLVIVAACLLSACEKKPAFDREAVLRWSQADGGYPRSKAASYSFQHPDGSWVMIANARFSEEHDGFMYSGDEVLKSGYLVYPGGHFTGTIEEAIRLCEKIEGKRFRTE